MSALIVALAIAVAVVFLIGAVMALDYQHRKRLDPADW
jgi:hypothetical protein